MNRQQNALVDSLECYMDEVVESFEDFVKKSLLLFSVGVCTVVVMLVYVLKMLTERASAKTLIRKNSTMWSIDKEKLYPILSTHEVTVQQVKPNLTCTSANTIVMKSIWPSYEEQVLRNIGFSNCHKCMQMGESFENLHTRHFTLSSESNRQSSISISPARRRRDLSLPSRPPDHLHSPPLEGIWNIPRVMPPMPIPIFDNRDGSHVDNADVESQLDITNENEVETRNWSNIDAYQRHESKSANTNVTTPEIASVSWRADPAPKLSWTILTRDAAAIKSHIHRIQCRVADRGKTPSPPRTHRLLLSPARRCPSQSPHRPSSKPLQQRQSAKLPQPSQRKISQKISNNPRHGDYLRTRR